MVDYSFLDAQVSENADLSFIWAVLNICLKHLSSSICVLIFKEECKEVEIENCTVVVFVVFFSFVVFCSFVVVVFFSYIIIYFKPVSSGKDFILIILSSGKHTMVEVQ